MATISVMFILFALSGGQPIGEYFNSLKHSFSLFFQLTPVDYRWPMGILLLSILERILGLLFPALKVLALRRMLERVP